MTNPIIKDYQKMLAALTAGATSYLENRQKGTQPTYPGIGFFHSDKGIKKANRLRHHVITLEMQDMAILALATAIFTSSSTWLAAEIAEKMISGKWSQSFSSLTKENNRSNTIASEVFDLSAINRFRAEDVTAHGRYFYHTQMHKLNTVKALLREAIKQLFLNDHHQGISRKQFEKKVAEYKAHLLSDDNLIDMGLGQFKKKEPAAHLATIETIRLSN